MAHLSGSAFGVYKLYAIKLALEKGRFGAWNACKEMARAGKLRNGQIKNAGLPRRRNYYIMRAWRKQGLSISV